MIDNNNYWITDDIPTREMQVCISNNVVEALIDAFDDSEHFLEVKNGELIIKTLGPEKPSEDGITGVFKVESKLSDLINLTSDMYGFKDKPEEKQFFIDAFEKILEQLKAI